MIFIRTFCAASLLALASLNSPLAAQGRFEPVRPAAQLDLDPQAAYLLVQAFDGVTTIFVRQPSESDRALWRAERDAAYAQARAEYDVAREEYDRAHAEWRGRGGYREPEAPFEPTEATFEWPALEVENTLFTLAGEQFSGEGSSTLWLYRVPAGAYSYYGRAYLISGQPGTIDCACLGSVQFDVPAGQITAIEIAVNELDASANRVAWAQRSRNPIDGEIRRAPRAGPIEPQELDPRLPADRIVDASLAPFPRQDNWSGGTINRVLPIEGVLGYEGDLVVDMRPGQ